MSQNSESISKRIQEFKNEVVGYVENLSDEDWKKICSSEGWTVGVTARHIGAGHFAISNMLNMIVEGQELPQLSMDQINEMSKKDALKHSDCTKAEALEKLRANGAELAEFVAGLDDDQLGRKGNMPAFGGEVTTKQCIDYVIFQSAVEHFDSMKTAVGR